MATTEPDPPHHPTVPAPLEHMPAIDTETSIDLHTVGVMNKDVCGGVGEVGEGDEVGEAEVGNRGMDADINEEEEEVDQLEEQEEELVENVDEVENVFEELAVVESGLNGKNDVVQVDATPITQPDAFDAVVLEDDEEGDVENPVETVQTDVEPATFVVESEPTHDEPDMIPLDPFPKDTQQLPQDPVEEEYVENLDDDDMDIYEPLPCVLLEYRNGFFPMFAPYTPSPAVAAAAMTEARTRGTTAPPIVPATDQRVLFGSDDYTPVSTPLKQNITETDMVNNVLYESPMYYLIRELKSVFGIPDTCDVSMEFPDLDLRVHQDMGCVVNRVSVKRLTEFHRLVYEKRCSEGEIVGAGVDGMGPLRVVMIRHSWSVMKKIAWLEELAKEGGMNTNPIVLDSEGDDEDEQRGKSNRKSGDEDGRLRNEIDDMIHDDDEEEDYDMEEIGAEAETAAEAEETIEAVEEVAAEEAVVEVGQEAVEETVEVAEADKEAEASTEATETSTEIPETTKETEKVAESTVEEVVIVGTTETVQEPAQDLTETCMNDAVAVVDTTIETDTVESGVDDGGVEHDIEIGDVAGDDTGDDECVVENGVLEDWHDDDDVDGVDVDAESEQVYNDDDDQPNDDDDDHPNGGGGDQHDDGEQPLGDAVTDTVNTEPLDTVNNNNDTIGVMSNEKRDRDDMPCGDDVVAKRVRI